VGTNRFANLSEAIFESGDTVGLFGVGSGTQNVQQEPKTGHKRDGRERQNCEFMARQTDQFNTKGLREGGRLGCWLLRLFASEFPDSSRWNWVTSG
jgi:hypothetical protein